MHKQRGFSLTEMSVVLVLIAFIIAAVMQGRNLIEGAKVRSIVSDISKYRVSINSFYGKYNQFPGDFNEAVAHWGGTTEDGNNNGKIEFLNGESTAIYEGYRAWQHLSYAQMVDVPLSGSVSGSTAIVGTHVPEAKTGGGFLLEYGVFGLTNVNALILGVPAATDAAPVKVNGILTASQAMDVDSKIDDGKPSAGIVRGQDGSGAGEAGKCVTSGVYALNIEGKSCTIAVKTMER